MKTSDDNRRPAPRRVRSRAPRLRGFSARILCALCLFSASSASFPQGVEIKTNNAGGTSTQRFKVDTGADTVNAWFLNANVGIGTTTPGARLHVSGGTAGDGEILLEADTDNNDEADNPYLTFRQDGGGVNAFLGLEGNAGTRATDSLGNAFLVGSEDTEPYVQLVTSDTVRMTVTPAGDVGIGTTGPARTLDVAGTITSTGSDAPFTTSNWGRALELPHAGAVVWKKGAGDYAWGIGKTSAASKLYFFRSSADDNSAAPGYDMVIENDGDVGIGTTTADARLQIAGGPLMPAVGNAATAGIQFPSDPGGGGGDSAWIRYYAEAGEDMKLRIGTDNDADDDISFWQAGAERMNLYGGNVGIGYTTPSVTLDVGGTIRAKDVFAADGQNIIVGDDTYLSDVDAQSTMGFHSTTSGFSFVKLGSSGGTIEGRTSGNVRFSPNVIFSNSTPGTVRLRTAGGNNIWFNWDGTARCMVDVTNVKNFVIDHPADPGRYLVHTCLEGPESAVFYRGTAQLRDGRAEIVLPAYFEALVREEGRTVQVSPEYGSEDEPVSDLAASPVRDGRFRVRAMDGANPGQRFSWEVKGVRRDVAPLLVEPRRDGIDVHGTGPYTYYTVKKTPADE